MSLQPTTIILSPELNHSITYDAITSSLTANLPTPTPIKNVPNKQKLMLLIYFVLRDKEHVSSPRKIDGQISLEFGIVERILLQFSNLAQAKRTLNEYTNVKDQTDTRNGTKSGRQKEKNMDITEEVRNTLLAWFNDVLGPKNVQKARMQQDISPTNTTDPIQSKKRSRTTRARQNALPAEDTAPSDDPISDPPNPPPATVKKRRQSKLSKENTSILTPGPPSSLPLHELTRPSTADMSSDYIQRFMSSPEPANKIVPTSVPKKGSLAKDDRESTSKSSESDSDSSSKGRSRSSERSKSDDENSEGSKSGPKSSARESSDGSSNGSSDNGDHLEMYFANIDSVSEDKSERSREEPDHEMDDFVKKVDDFVKKVDDYAKLLYKNARLGQDAKVRKYTRKLKRLARKIRSRRN